MQTQLQRSKHDPSETRCKLTLLILFLLGAALILGGFWGIRQYQQSGFDQEVGYRYIQKLSGEVESLYTQSIQPVMARLTDAEREALTLEAAALLKENWTAAVKADQSARADEMLAGLEGDKLQQKTIDLLSITYSLNGPKVASAEKKQLAKWTDAERSQNREALLRAVLDESAPLPQAVASAVGELTGSERAAALMQLFLVSANAENEPLPTDHVNSLKKAARNAEARISAYEMTADGSVSLLSQLLISHSRTAILLGILLALDIALLFLMLYKDHSWHLDFKWAIILLIVDFMLVFQVLPMVYLIIKAFFPEGSFTFDVFQRLYTYQMNLGALKNTLIAATVTMVLGTLIAFPLAWLVGRTNLFGKKFFRSLFVLTYMVPPYVGAMAWLRLLNPNVGTMNQFFRMIFGLGDTPGPLNIYTLGGLIWVLTTFYYPYAFITISRAMEKMDPSLEEAARDMGASRWKVFTSVTLPLMLPGLGNAFLVTFIESIADFANPMLIGGSYDTLATTIYLQITGSYDKPGAAAMAVVLLCITLAMFAVQKYYLERKTAATLTGKASRGRMLIEDKSVKIPLTILCGLAATFVILMYLCVPIGAFFPTWGYKFFPLTGKWFKLIFTRYHGLQAFWDSFRLSLISAPITALLSMIISYLVVKRSFKSKGFIEAVSMLAMAVPGTVLGVGYIRGFSAGVFRTGFLQGLYGTGLILIIVFVVRSLPTGTRSGISALRQIDKSIEESAYDMGADSFKVFMTVTLPLIKDSFLSGLVTAFVRSITAISAIILLVTPQFLLITVQINEFAEKGSYSLACAFATILIVITYGAVLLMNLFMNHFGTSKKMKED